MLPNQSAEAKTIRVPIEVDITYVNKHWHSKRPQPSEKHYVIGFCQRRSEVRIQVLPDNKTETIHRIITENIAAGCTIYAEEKILPPSLKEIYDLQELKTSDGHVKGDFHVNHVKNMWRDLKRLIKTTHISVSKEHLQGYCNEVAWRINNAHLSPMERFEKLMSVCATKKP